MIIARIANIFATRIDVFVKSLTEAMPGCIHIFLHGKRKKKMTSTGHRSIDPLKDLLALAEVYIMLRRFKPKKVVETVHLPSSKNGLKGGMYIFKPLTKPGYFTLNNQIKAEMAA